MVVHIFKVYKGPQTRAAASLYSFSDATAYPAASAPAPGFAWPYHEEEICASCLYVYCLYMYCLYVYCLYVYRLYVNCLYVYCLYVCCLYVYCLYVYCLYVYCPYVCCTNAFQV